MSNTPTPGRLACFTNRSSRDRWPFLGEAANGPHMDGYQEPEPGKPISCTTSAGCHGTLESNLHRLDEGGWVCDTRHLDSDAQVRRVVSGPMLKVDLPAGTVDRFSSPTRKPEPAPGDLSTLRGFDTVAVDVYLRYAETFGAKVGQRLGDEIVWRDGSRTPVPPCECWKGVCVGCGKLRYYTDRLRTTSSVVKTRTPEHPFDHCLSCKQEAE